MIYEIEYLNNKILITVQASEDAYNSDTDAMWIIETLGL